MKQFRAIMGAAIITTSLVGAAGPASAAPVTPPSTADIVGTVKIDPSNPGVAYVLARYRCTVADPENTPAHLWVSAKQNASRTVDPAVSGSHSGWGGVAYAWQDSHRNAVDCDGQTHTQRFSIDQVEGKAGWATLAKGDAWVQFCLFDDTTPDEPVSSMEWTPVR